MQTDLLGNMYFRYSIGLIDAMRGDREMSERGAWKEEYKKTHGLNNYIELRLIPYIQYLAVNRLAVDPAKINADERKILQKWRNEGKLMFGMFEPVALTKQMWDWMNEVLWDSYVLKDNDDDNTADFGESQCG